MPNSAKLTNRSHWPISILSICTATLSIAIPLLLVRLLSPDEVGRFKIFFLYLLLGPTCTMTIGLQNGLSYWAGNQEKWKQAFHASGVLILGAAALVLTAVLAFHSTFGALLGFPADETLVFACAIGATLAAGFFEDAAISRGLVWRGAIYHAGFEFVRIALITAAAWSYRSILAVFVAHTAVTLLRALAGYIAALRLGFVGGGFERDTLRQVLRYAFPVSLAAAAGVLVTNVDQLILSQHLAPAAFALYSIGCLSVPPLLILERSITRVLIPEMAEAFARRDDSRAAGLHAEAVRSLGFFLIPAAAGLALFAEPITQILFTERYLPAAAYLRVFAFSYVLLALPSDAVARALGDARWILRSLIACSVISMLSVIVLITYFGAYGALTGALFAALLLRIVACIYMVKRTDRALGDFVPIRYLLLTGAATIAAAASAAALRSLFTSGLRWFVVGALVFAAVYFGVQALCAAAFQRRKAVAPVVPAPQRVLMLLQNVNIGGLERMVLALSAGLVRRGQTRVLLAVYDQDPDSQNLLEAFRRAGIEVSVYRKRAGFSLVFLVRLIRHLRREKIDIVHCHDLGGLIYAALARRLARLRFRLYMTQHGFIHLDHCRRYALYEKIFSRCADQLIAVSPQTADMYRRLHVPAERVALLPNGVEFLEDTSMKSAREARDRIITAAPAMLRARLGAFREAVWILYLARIFPQKGQDRAIAVWNELYAPLRKEAVLVFVGPEGSREYARELKARAGRALDPERIFFAGPALAPHEWLAACDLFLSCSEYEGMPLGPLEAAGSGIPALLSDIAGHETFEGFCEYIPLQRPRESAQRLARVLDELRAGPEAMRARLRREARPLREWFSVEVMVRRYAALYEAHCAAACGFVSDNASAVPAPSSGSATLAEGA